eukprot:224375_1
MSLKYAIFCIVLLLHPIQPLNWIQPKYPLIPKHIYGSNIGYNAESSSIWLIGGKTSFPYQSLIEYNIASDNFTVHSDLPQQTYSAMQQYTQIRDVVYIFVPFYSGNYISKFNLTSTIYDTKAVRTQHEGLSELRHPCMTNIKNEYLVILGGRYIIYEANTYKVLEYVYFNNFTLYDLANEIWFTGPNMPQNRSFSSCAVQNDLLYNIGGWNPHDQYTNLDSIISINVSNTNNLTSVYWHKLPFDLSLPRSNSRAVVYGNLIFVIGGWINGVAQNVVDVIDTSLNIIYSDNYLVTAVATTAVVIASDYNMIFAFGGDNGTYISGINTFQYALLTTTANVTTTNTSVNPIATNLTTINPTVSPIAANPTTSNSTIINPVIFTTSGPMKHELNYILLILTIVFAALCVFACVVMIILIISAYYKNHNNKQYSSVELQDKKVEIWLTETVKLPQYYELLIENGIDEMTVIKLIGREDLQAMNICIGHQLKILQAVEALKSEEGNYLVDTIN